MTILDIPNRADFEAVGVALLDQSWEMATSLLVQLEDAREFGLEQDDISGYWASASTTLATALTIAHQGAEFLIKSRIAEVSPFLLIANSPKEWPKADAAGQLTFSAFRTVDAQDLVRLHDACATTPLNSEFTKAFELLRLRRNSIMHTVDPTLKLHGGELIVSILKVHNALMPHRDWIETRRETLAESAASQLFSSDWVEASVVKEFCAVRGALQPAEMKAYFNHNKKQRAYICPHCSWDVCADFDYEAHVAVLKPNTPASTRVYCFICKQEQPITRQDCQQSECLGNVVSDEWAKCLTCGTSQE